MDNCWDAHNVNDATKDESMKPGSICISAQSLCFQGTAFLQVLRGYFGAYGPTCLYVMCYCKTKYENVPNKCKAVGTSRRALSKTPQRRQGPEFCPF